MKTKPIFLIFIAVMGFLNISKAQPMTDKEKSASNEKLAQKLVSQCANIHEGEIVLITGGVRDFDLLEDIVINVRKIGAFPLLSIESDRMTRRRFTEVPVKYDTQVPELDLKIMNFADALINVDYSETTGLLADVPPERFVALGKANKPVNELFSKRKVKGVNLGNGLYPTEALAKQFDLPPKELTELFWKGVNVDYSKLESTGKALKTILSGGKEIQITNPNGTDLKVKIEKRETFVSDGILSADDLKRGAAGAQVFLPAGEVYLAPVQGTAEGKVVVDRLFYQGKEINGITLTFKEGKLISMTAGSGLEPLKAIYDAAEKGKEEFAFVDLGINPDVILKPGSKVVAWMPAGMITIGIGNNTWAGGDNNTPFGFPFFLPGSTLKVDGKIVTEKGVLKY